MKRQPLLIDRVLAGMHKFEAVYPKPVMAQVKTGLLEAKRFVLDDDASAYVGAFIADMPEFIAEGQEFAIPPFTKMYVEVDSRRFHEPMASLSDHESDERFGYLFLGPQVYVLASGSAADIRPIPVAITPFRYTMNVPMMPEQERKWCSLFNITRAQLDVWLWGATSLRLKGDALRSLRSNHSVSLLRELPDAPVREIEALLLGSSGDLRNIIALLLFLNRTSDIQVVDKIGHHRAMIHNKPALYLSHSVIRLKLNPKKTLREVYGHGGAWRRMHDVRGHFCHNKKAREANCIHDWSEVGVNRWSCLKCRGEKWWRKEHIRGHDEKGRVESSYEVVV